MQGDERSWGTKTRKRPDGRYETRAVLDTPTEHRRVSFYGKTAKEANDRKTEALANQNKGILFRTPAASPSPITSRSVAKMLGYLDPDMTPRRFAHALYEMRDDAGRASRTSSSSPDLASHPNRSRHGLLRRDAGFLR